MTSPLSVCTPQSSTAFLSSSACPWNKHSRQRSCNAKLSLSLHNRVREQVATHSTIQIATSAELRSSCRSQRPARQLVCRAQQQDEKEKDMVGGFDVDSPAGFLESEAVGIVFKVGFFLFVSAGVAAILLLARPVIDNTIQAFPYRTSGGGEQSADKSLIPGLESGPSESTGDSIFD